MVSRSEDKVFMLKKQAVVGTAETLAPATDAMLTRNPQATPNFDNLVTDEVSSSISSSVGIVGGGWFGFNGEILLRGAGVAGTAPKYGELLEIAALSVVLQAADINGTAQAGGTANTVPLAAGESATDGIHVGKPILFDGGTGAGDPERVITAYNGTTKVATVFPDFVTTPDITTTYEIPANALYVPSSADCPVATVQLIENAKEAGSTALLQEILDAAAELNLNFTVRGLPFMGFTVRGVLAANPTNVTRPAGVVLESFLPEPFEDAETFFGAGTAPQIDFNAFSIALGNEVQQPDKPGAQYGYGQGIVTKRKVTGTINPPLSLLSDHNPFADWVGNVTRKMWHSYGSAAGRRHSIYLPGVKNTSWTPGDVDGFNVRGIDFEADGIDSEMYWCFW